MPAAPGSRTCLSDPEQHACQSQDMSDISRWTTCLSDPGGQHACHTWEDNMPVTPRRTTCMSDQAENMPVIPGSTTCLTYPGGHVSQSKDNMPVRPWRTACLSDPVGQHACCTWEQNMFVRPRTTCLSEPGGNHACQIQEGNMPFISRYFKLCM